MLSRKEVTDILEKDDTTPFPSRLIKLFYSISYYTGFSVDKMRNLKWSAVNTEEGIIEGGEHKITTIEEVKKYLDELEDISFDTGRETFMFTDAGGNQLTEEYITREFEKTMESAGIDYKKRKLTPNCFRRTYNFWYA